MRIALTLFLIAFTTLSFSQITLERQVIGSTGQSATSASLQVDYTVGETVVNTATSSTVILTQGFHQPTDALVYVESPEWDLNWQAYPNPTQGTVMLEAFSAQPLDIQLTIYNTKGQMVSAVEHFTLDQQWQHTIDFSGLASGTYFIRIQYTKTAKDLSITVQKIQ